MNRKHYEKNCSDLFVKVDPDGWRLTALQDSTDKGVIFPLCGEDGPHRVRLRISHVSSEGVWPLSNSTTLLTDHFSTRALK